MTHYEAVSLSRKAGSQLKEHEVDSIAMDKQRFTQSQGWVSIEGDRGAEDGELRTVVSLSRKAGSHRMKEAWN
jgi:hypothetical protein